MTFFLFDIIIFKEDALKYLYILPAYWIIAAIILLLLISKFKTNIKKNINSLLFFFSTPFPALFGFYIYMQFASTLDDTLIRDEEILIRNNRLVKVESFRDESGVLRKVHYSTSKTQVGDTLKLKILPEFLMDSIVYFDEKGIKTDKISFEDKKGKRRGND